MRRLATFIGAALLATGVMVTVESSPASAHGATQFPGARTWFCYLELIENGHTQPSNPACLNAFQQSGSTPLYNWFAVLDSNGQGRTEGYIPNGEICTGGNNGPFDFSGYEAARSDWPKTHLTAGSTIEVHHNNWAHHPGDFDVYITRPGWSPTTPLAWNDLELVQTVTNPPSNGGPGAEDHWYHWNLQLPSDRSGEHMMFIHWIRSDSPENFYSCSDIVFDGGNGEVTGLGADGEMSADEVAAAMADFENVYAEPVHEHGEHAAHADAAVDEESSVASMSTSSAAALAGAAVVAFAGGVAAYGGRRRWTAQHRR